MHNGQIAINAANVQRFNNKCTSIITNLKAFADQQDQQDLQAGTTFADRVMTQVATKVFRRLEVQDLTTAFLRSVADVVKTVLGANEVLPTDLLYLPLVDSSLKL